MGTIPKKEKLRLSVCLLEATVCMQHVGSTIDVAVIGQAPIVHATKLCTWMYRHCIDGCPLDEEREKDQLRLTLLDFLDTMLSPAGTTVPLH